MSQHVRSRDDIQGYARDFSQFQERFTRDPRLACRLLLRARPHDMHEDTLSFVQNIDRVNIRHSSTTSGVVHYQGHEAWSCDFIDATERREYFSLYARDRETLGLRDLMHLVHERGSLKNDYGSIIDVCILASTRLDLFHQDILAAACDVAMSSRVFHEDASYLIQDITSARGVVSAIGDIILFKNTREHREKARASAQHMVGLIPELTPRDVCFIDESMCTNHLIGLVDDHDIRRFKEVGMVFGGYGRF